MKLVNVKVVQAVVVILMAGALVNCGKSSSSAASSTEDTSASSVAAEAAGGALSNSSSSGTQARMSFNLPTSKFAQLRSELNPFPTAAAQLLCPTFRSTDSSCSASGGNMWLTYDDCSFTGVATWNGVQELSMSTGTATCGSFPNPGDNGTLYRQYVTASNASTPSEISLTTPNYSGSIDDASTNLANFNGDTISTIHNGGYGASVSFNASGARSAITLGHHISVVGVYDHSVTGSLTVTEVSGATQRVLSGSVTVYHNLMKVIGTSTFNNVVHENVCCVPVSGSVTTVFTAGTVSPTTAGESLVGKSETLTFTGCGTAILQGTDGQSKDVTLNRCF